LASILSERNISREEFDIILQRNAYLRKIVQSEESFTEVELRDEYDRACGERVRVRHIQLATAREVARVQERLDAGVPFAHLARENNANEFSAAADGLLEPFARSEDRIPIALRDAAFSLSPGEVSPPIREGAWFHLIRLEERVAVESVDFDQIKEALIERLRARNSDQRMYERYEQLFRAAAVAIHDPVLREAYFLAHPRAGASR
jgi:parvulin-like peptidyl-prolyl isomerase